MDAVKTILELGANPNATDFAEQPVIHWAIHYNDTTMVNLLLRHGADIEKPNVDGLTPFLFAISEVFFFSLQEKFAYFNISKKMLLMK
jgi:ankyrin repeat protein